MKVSETIPLRDLLDGTDAAYIIEEGYDIVGLEWVDGGLKIVGDDHGMQETPSNAVALADGRTPEEAEAVRRGADE